MKLEIKGLKTMQGHDGLVFQATVYVDRKKAFMTSNDGNGGCHLYDRINDDSYNLIRTAEAWAKTLPQRTGEVGGRQFTYDCDLDCVINDLLDAELERRWLKGQCRAKTLFRTADTPAGQWRVVNMKYDEHLRLSILAKYPGAEIANERI